MNSFLFTTQLIISMTLQADDDELKPFAMSDAAPDAPGQLNNLGNRSGRDGESLFKKLRDAALRGHGHEINRHF
jgi:hypothetical protein